MERCTLTGQRPHIGCLSTDHPADECDQQFLAADLQYASVHAEVTFGLTQPSLFARRSHVTRMLFPNAYVTLRYGVSSRPCA